MSELKDEFARIRAALDEADRSLAGALEARAKATRDYASLRERDPEGYYALARDVEVIAAIKQRIKTFPAASVESVVREVLSGCAALVAPVRVAYLGPEAGFGHLAGRRHFGTAAELLCLDDVSRIVEEVARARTQFGVVPLETSSEGVVTATLHALSDSELKICAEIPIAASYHLFSKTGNEADVEKIYAARAALAACERNLRTNFPRATTVDVRSGLVAGQMASEDHGAAAVGTEMLIGLYDLRQVRQRIEDQANVETRFAVIGDVLPPRTGTDRTVLALAVHDAPGSLLKALEPFAERGVNLTRLESRPAAASAWRYLFFVELDGHITDRPVLTAVEELRSESRFVKMLGSYPRPS